MDISALVHRHAEAVVIPACRNRHTYLLCFALMAFYFPRQLGAMDNLDEEMQLINVVALLDSQLEQTISFRKLFFSSKNPTNFQKIRIVFKRCNFSEFFLKLRLCRS
jgi:hypothetical protein